MNREAGHGPSPPDHCGASFGAQVVLVHYPSLGHVSPRECSRLHKPKGWKHVPFWRSLRFSGCGRRITKPGIPHENIYVFIQSISISLLYPLTAAHKQHINTTVYNTTLRALCRGRSRLAFLACVSLWVLQMRRNEHLCHSGRRLCAGLPLLGHDPALMRLEQGLGRGRGR